MFLPGEKEELVGALEYWAERAPNIPIIGFLDDMTGGPFLTPRQIVEEVRAESSDGLAILEIFEHGVRRDGLKSVIQRIIDSLEKA